ncbi:MAG: hypothetical protein IPK60_12395 [Sandaracinaceae bacterium]|nr:hypothetical protein [Sandaracinaceae bacterium]
MYDPVDAPRDPDRPIPPRSLAPPERYGKPVDLHRVALTYWRARYWLLFTAAFGIALGVVVAKLLVPHTYTASTQLVWEPDNGGQPRLEPDVRELRTLVDSLKIQANLAEIRRRRSMPKTLDQIAAQLDIHFDLDSNLVEVFAHESTAEGAADLANTTVDVFLERERTLERTRREEQVHSLDADSGSARHDLTTARTAYDQFRTENGIADLSVETQQAIESAATLTAQAEIERARMRAARSAAAQHRANPGTPLVIVDEQASHRLTEARAELARLRAQLSDQHPQVQAAQAQVRSLEEALRARQAAAVAATPSPAPNTPNQPRPAPNTEDNAVDQTSTIERLAANARQRVQALSAVEGRASELLAAVRVHEARVSDIEQARARAQDAARTPSPGFRVVSPAWRPENPSRSYRKIAAIAIPSFVFFVVVLGIAIFAVGRMRVFTATEVAYWGRAPVIGSSTWPHDGQSVKVLVEELDDFAPRARGTTLIVGATASEDAVAQEIAQRLQVYAVAVVDPNNEAVVTPQYATRTRSQPPASATSRQTIINTPPPPAGPGSGIVPTRQPANIVPSFSGYQVAELSDMPRSEPPREPHVIELWKGDLAGPQLRRQARLADRVVVVLTSGSMTFAELHALQTQIGRETGVGYLVVGMPPYLSKLEDRIGPVDEFWRQRRQ